VIGDGPAAATPPGKATGPTSASWTVERLKQARQGTAYFDPLTDAVARAIARDPSLSITSIDFTNSAGQRFRLKRIT
jgi:hypothetical protein